MILTTAVDVTTIPELHRFRSYCLVVAGVAIDVTFDPADRTYGLAYAWAPDDYADGFPASRIGQAITEWVAEAPADHPEPYAGCYGCMGRGTLQGFRSRPGVACSCVTVHPDSL